MTIESPSQPTDELARLRETVGILANNEEVLVERLAELELALEDQSWTALLGGDDRQFTKAAIDRISALSRIMAIKNPLIKRSVAVLINYTWGQGINIEARDPDINAVIQAFLDDPANQAELTSHQAAQDKDRELECDGNIFFVLFARPDTGRVRVRSIPLPEIVDVVTNPEDAKDPWFYLRSWTEREMNPATGRYKTTRRKAYYPALRHQPAGADRPEMIGRIPVYWDRPVLHVKIGGFSDWRYGISDVYASIDWARAYKEFMEDWATITRAYARFAFKMTTPGGKRGVAAAKTRLGTTLGAQGGTGVETNPPATTGSMFIAQEGVNLDPVKTAGATTRMEDGRRLLLMVVAGIGLPETFLGDASVGTVATAESLDRPTELMMSNRQVFWRDVYDIIIDYVLLWAVKAPKGALHGQAKVVIDEDGERLVWPESANPHVSITFPPIVEINPASRIGAVMQGSAVLPDQRYVARLVLSALGEREIDEVLALMYPEDAEGEPAEESEEDQAVEADLRATIRDLRESIAALGRREAIAA